MTIRMQQNPKYRKNNYTFQHPEIMPSIFADGSWKTDGIYLPVSVNAPINASVSVVILLVEIPMVKLRLVC